MSKPSSEFAEPLQQRAVEELEKIAFFGEMAGDNPFKIRAFKKSAEALQGLSASDFDQRLKENTLDELDGVGKGTLLVIQAVREKGKSSDLEKLALAYPESLLELRKVPGLGPKKIKSVYEALEIESLSELEYACQENRLVDLKGFGTKTQSSILEAISHLRSQEHFHSGLTAYTEAQALLASLGKDALLVGEVARSCEIVEAIDLFLLSPDKKINLPATTPEGIPIRVHRATGKSPVSEAFLLTGSDRFLEEIQRVCREKHFTLDANGLRDSKSSVTLKDERDLFRTLGLHFVPPELREGYGEVVSLEKKSPFPAQLIEASDLKGAYHNHTNFSDGANSLEEMVAAAQALGWEWIGISDHSQTAVYASGLNAKRLEEQREEISKLQKTFKDIRILHGVESDIHADGTLDYPDSVLKKLDFVIASVHNAMKLPEEKMTARLVKALSHPCTTLLGHPTGRLLLGRKGYAFNWEKVLKVAVEEGKAIELNANPYRLDVDWRVLRGSELGRRVCVSINPDAHSTLGLRDLNDGVRIARKGALSKDRLLSP